MVTLFRLAFSDDQFAYCVDKKVMRKPKNQTMDIALDVLCILCPPGQTMSAQDIADVCGCSKQYIYYIEKSAMANLKRKLAGGQINDFIDVNPRQNHNETLLNQQIGAIL